MRERLLISNSWESIVDWEDHNSAFSTKSLKLKEEKGTEVELWVVSHKTLIHQSYNKCYTCFYLYTR